MSEVNFTIKLKNHIFHLVSLWQNQTSHVKMHTHSNSSYELHLIVSGQGILRLANQEYEIKQGMLYLTGPGIPHEQIPSLSNPTVELGLYYTVSAPSKKHAKHLDAQENDWITTLVKKHFWIGESPQEISHLMNRIYEEVSLHNTGYQEILPFLTGCLLIQLSRLYNSEKINTLNAYIPKAEDEKYLQIERYFLNNANTVTLTALAKEVNLSIRQLQRLIKNHYGTTFKKMQTDYKLQLACRLLKETEETVSFIAEATGFSSADYFGYCFKQKFGITPLKYRKHYQ